MASSSAGSVPLSRGLVKEREVPVSVSGFYTQVVEQVIKTLRPEFQNIGLEDSVLNDVQTVVIMPGFSSYHRLPLRTKNLIMLGGLTAFVGAIYIYTMRAVGGTDELQIAIDTIEKEKHEEELLTKGKTS